MNDRISAMLRRVFKRSVNPATPSQQAQIESLADEVHGNVELLEQYAYTSVAPPEVDEGLAAFVAGESDHGVVLGWFDKTHRPTTLEPGEAQMYSKFGQSIYLDKLGQITLKDQAGSTLTLKTNGDILAVPASGLYKVTGELRTTSHIVCGGNLTVANNLQAVNIDATNIDASNNVTAGNDVVAGDKVIGTVDVLADTISLKTHKHGGVVAGGAQTGVPV